MGPLSPPPLIVAPPFVRPPLPFPPRDTRAPATRREKGIKKGRGGELETVLRVINSLESNGGDSLISPDILKARPRLLSSLSLSPFLSRIDRWMALVDGSPVLSLRNGKRENSDPVLIGSIVFQPARIVQRREPLIRTQFPPGIGVVKCTAQRARYWFY